MCLGPLLGMEKEHRRPASLLLLSSTLCTGETEAWGPWHPHLLLLLLNAALVTPTDQAMRREDGSLLSPRAGGLAPTAGLRAGKSQRDPSLL